MNVHLYAHCWNEEAMLPHFFRHYDAVVDAYFIYDTGSTDRSLEILRSHPRVHLSTPPAGGASFIEENTARQNHCWKASRGRADWVVITAIDEHLYHPDLRRYFDECRRSGVTILRAEGYEMVSDVFPSPDRPEPLCRRITFGKREPLWFDKIQAFDPGKIREINYESGRHAASPLGAVVWPEKPELKLLHYKNLGVEYVLQRYAQLKTGLREGDIAKHLGAHYLWDRNTIVRRFEQIRRAAVQAV